MDRLKDRIHKSIGWATKNRNLLFLAVCLVIHGIYACVFYALEVWSLALLNGASCCFYFNALFIKKDMTEKRMVSTYFEILMFSVITELVLGPEYGFLLYIVGMSSAVFYLVPSYGNLRFVYQIVGIVTALVLEGVIRIFGIRFEHIQAIMSPFRTPFYLVNIGITAMVVLGATFFYAQETEAVWESLRYNMNHDALTGLYNRRFLERYIESIPFFEQKPYVIVMVDIDFFKKVNDTYGHEAGDRVLVKVASCLKETAGEGNLAVRWGGEEFILYFPETAQDEVYPMIEELRKEVASMVIRSGRDAIRVTITSGISFGVEGSDYEKVIRSADEKLYLGKQRGRNRVIM